MDNQLQDRADYLVTYISGNVLLTKNIVITEVYIPKLPN